MEVLGLNAAVWLAGAALAATGVLLPGCGAPNEAPVHTAAQATKQANVIISVDAVHHVCLVALSNEEQGSSIACGEAVAFLKDELRVPAGATYDVRTAPGVSDAEVAGVKERLNMAGYRFLSAQ